MNHGDVWTDAHGRKVVVVSSDQFHGLTWPGLRPLVVPVIRERRAGSAPWVVPTCEADPVTGSVAVPMVAPAGDLTERVGMLAGVTMAAVHDGLRAVFDL